MLGAFWAPADELVIRGDGSEPQAQSAPKITRTDKRNPFDILCPALAEYRSEQETTILVEHDGGRAHKALPSFINNTHHALH